MTGPSAMNQPLHLPGRWLAAALLAVSLAASAAESAERNEEGIPFVERCTLRGKFGEAKGSLCNLSVLGVYAALDRIPEPGTEATLAFRLPQFPGLFERPVVVVWQNLDRPDRVHALPPGCGLRFTYLSPVDQELLAARVNEYLVGLEAAVR